MSEQPRLYRAIMQVTAPVDCPQHHSAGETYAMTVLAYSAADAATQADLEGKRGYPRANCISIGPSPQPGQREHETR
mgnify:CR=1 FL=1